MFFVDLMDRLDSKALKKRRAEAEFRDTYGVLQDDALTRVNGIEQVVAHRQVVKGAPENRLAVLLVEECNGSRIHHVRLATKTI